MTNSYFFNNTSGKTILTSACCFPQALNFLITPVKKYIPPENTDKATWCFIDEQNLFRGVRFMGWKINWFLFRQLLRLQFGVARAVVFMGYIPANAPLYATIRRAGFEIEFREVRVLKDGTLDNANIDTDLVCYALDNKSNYDKALIVADDSDFLSLIKTLDRQGKLKAVISTHSLQYTSRDIKKALTKEKIVSIEALRNQIAYQKVIAA